MQLGYELKAYEKDISFVWECSESIAMNECSTLEQALVNLIDNAIKYSPKSGQVEIRAIIETSEVIIQPDQALALIPGIWTNF